MATSTSSTTPLPRPSPSRPSSTSRSPWTPPASWTAQLAAALVMTTLASMVVVGVEQTGETRTPSTAPQVHEGNLRELLSDHEWAALLGGAADSDGTGAEFALFRPRIGDDPREPGHRSRRGADDGKVLQAEAMGRTFQLRLHPVAPILDPHFALLRSHHNHSEALDGDFADQEGRCLYRGRGEHGELAAVHLCDELTRGVIIDAASESSIRHFFVLQPLPSRLVGNDPNPTHVLLKRSLPPSKFSQVSADASSTCGLRSGDDNWTNRTSTPTSAGARRAPRARRSAREGNGNGVEPLAAVHIETAVFVDRDLIQHMALNFPVDTEREVVRFVLAMVNAVQLLYESPSLGRPVRLALKRLELLHAEPAGLRRSHDIDRFLSSFCAWQAAGNPGDDAHPLHWDHALILTGLDLYVVGKGGKVSSQVVGLAPVAGMCSASSCTVNEGRHFESVYVVAHEIGHNLGMRHDGPLSDNDCDPGSFLMSPTLGSGKTTWSACSRQYLHTFLQSPQSTCLLDGPGAELLDHSAGGVLPGERFDADQQCMLKYGRGAVHSEAQALEDACRDLHCRRDRYTWTSHPALDGTSCGRNKWCRLGRCVSRTTPAGASLLAGGAVDGGWSEWSPFSDCASGCLSEDSAVATATVSQHLHHLQHLQHHGEPDELRGSTGVMVSTRRCNNPRPENGGKPCQGSDRRYRTCTAPQCGNVARTTIRDFADQTCGRARDVQPSLLGTGLQMTSNDPLEACAVWCHMRSGGARPRAWSFPDGTACTLAEGPGPGGRSPTSRDDGASYCVGGRCEAFSCERGGPADSLFGLSPNRCGTPTGPADKQRPGSFNAASSFLQRLRDKGRRREAAVGMMGTAGAPPGPPAGHDEAAPTMAASTASLAASLKAPLEHASGCHSSCVTPGSGLRLVRRRGAGPCRGNCTLQTCEPDVLSCGRLRTPFEVASALCAKFRTRVRRLSGLGMQISAADDDRDRPCRVACQDEAVPHRFYLVNGRDGWFPFGTDCSRGRAVRAFCVSGRCLEFNDDGIPLYEPEASLPLPARDRRSAADAAGLPRGLLRRRRAAFAVPLDLERPVTDPTAVPSSS